MSGATGPPLTPTLFPWGEGDQERKKRDFHDSVPGLDTRSGLARCGGSAATYRKILRRFRKTQAAAPQRIRVALAASDRDTAEREAHSLKGVAGNIGADDEQAAAKTVEIHIEQKRNTDGALKALDGTLGNVIEKLSPVAVSTKRASEGTRTHTAADLGPLLNNLQRLLENSDAEAVDLVVEIESQLEGSESKERMQAIGERIDNFEFDEALDLLRALRETLSTQTSDSANIA